MESWEREKSLIVMMRRLTILTAVILVILAVGLYYMYDIVRNDKYSFIGILVFSAGLLGGFVSIQQRLSKLKDEELRLLSASWFSTALVPVNGGIFALVLMLMFMGGIIEGSLFPKYPDLTVSNLDTFKDWLTYSYPQTGSGLAKLFFWSFVAGFSERFVPRIINSTIKQTESAERKKSVEMVAEYSESEKKSDESHKKIEKESTGDKNG